MSGNGLGETVQSFNLVASASVIDLMSQSDSTEKFLGALCETLDGWYSDPIQDGKGP